MIAEKNTIRQGYAVETRKTTGVYTIGVMIGYAPFFAQRSHIKQQRHHHLAPALGYRGICTTIVVTDSDRSNDRAS